MNALLRDLLDAASIDAGHLAIAPHETSATDLVLDAISEFAPLAAEKGIGLAVGATPHAAQALVACDRNRIQQVLGNLIGNALKFTPHGGRITIRVEPRERELELSVADTGPGVAPDAAARIFERFARGPQRDLATGVGLGLFIAKGIVEAHGGRIWLASPAGSGATFCFTLPLASYAASDGTTSAPLIPEPTRSPTKDEP
jgi:signal transduction histidine kinase